MSTMRSVQLVRLGEPPQLREVPRPVPGPGQVLLQMTAAGLCHTDLHLMGLGPREFRWALPFSPGHEVVGTVCELGTGVSALSEGEPVAVYGSWGCGQCRTCSAGSENYCPHVRRHGIGRLGLGGPGGLAEYVLVDDARHLLPIGSLQPAAAVGLTDAGLTSHHVVHAEIERLAAGSTVLVIGVGGLGHMAIQVLRALTPAHVVAIDLADAKRDLAVRVGAHTVVSEHEVGATVRELTRGAGADVVLDFVGNDATLQLAVTSVRPGGSISIVGGGGGHLDVRPGQVPFGLAVSVPFWGARQDLAAVIAMAQAGTLTVHAQQYVFDDVLEAYADLANGHVLGRAVVVA